MERVNTSAKASPEKPSPPRRITSVKPRTPAINRTELLEKHVPTTKIIERLQKATDDGKRGLPDIEITKEIALDLLTLNDKDSNRDRKDWFVDLLVRTMLEKDWHYNGDPIRFSKSLKLLDGQHRLWAIYLSGKAQVFPIVLNLPEKAFSYIDIGLNRNSTDVFKIKGYKGLSTQLGYAVKFIILFEKYSIVSGAIREKAITNQDLMRWSADKEKVDTLIEFIEHAKLNLKPKAPFFTPGQWAALYHILYSLPGMSTRARKFVDSLADGIDTAKRSPIRVCREQLMTYIQKGHKSSRSQVSILTLKFKYAIRAWNHYVKREEIDRLSIDTRTMEIEKPIFSK